jgi:hypothetical protein
VSQPETTGALAAVVTAAPASVAEHAVAHPPADRFAGRFPPGATRGFVVEAIHEGWLLHYGSPRAFVGMDADLRLLAGDALYALGLARLAEEGDREAVAELADLISLTARAAVEGRPEWSEPLWAASVERLAPRGDGSQDESEAAAGAAAAFASLAS